MTDHLIKWDAREKCLVYPASPLGHLLSIRFEGTWDLDNRTLIDRLDAAGYDVTTLRLSIARKKASTP